MFSIFVPSNCCFLSFLIIGILNIVGFEINQLLNYQFFIGNTHFGNRNHTGNCLSEMVKSRLNMIRIQVDLFPSRKYVIPVIIFTHTKKSISPQIIRDSVLFLVVRDGSSLWSQATPKWRLEFWKSSASPQTSQR